MLTITSPENPEIKRIVKLHTTKERKKSQECIIEGQRAIATALENKLLLKKIFVTPERIDLARELVADQKNIIIIPDVIMAKISTATSPSGLLAIFAIPKQQAKIGPGLVLCDISDPGNMGTLIRTAAACNIKSVVIIEGTDPWSPKVIQASAGTIAQVHIFEWSWQELLANKNNLKLYALVVSEGQSVKTIKPEEALLVIGNEARGISQEQLKSCDILISLPMPGGTESLNAAVAGSIALYISFVYS